MDTRADVYGLGCTLYFLLTGQSPFADGTAAQKLLWHQTTDPARSDEVRPDVPRGLSDVVARMMRKSPDDRPPDPAAVAALLAAWAPPGVPPPPADEMPRVRPSATSSGCAGPPAPGSVAPDAAPRARPARTCRPGS